MRDLTFPYSKPKRALLDAAEQLFAERGFENVSMRDVTQLAKANVAAINYHFGSREELIALVMTRYITPVNEERIARLDKAERHYPEKVIPLVEIIDAFVRPLLTTVHKSELSEQMFFKLVGRIFAQQGQGMPPDLEEQLRILSGRFTKAFARALPELSVDEVIWRAHFMIGGMIHMLINHDLIQRVSQGAAGKPSMESSLGRLIRFAVAGLRDGLEHTEPIPEVIDNSQAIFNF